MIQYSVPPRFYLKRRGILDPPPARGMTMLCKPHRRLQRRSAQKFRSLHRRLAGTLQFENPDCALATGYRQAIVEQIANRARAIGQLAAQDLDPHRFALDWHLAPRTGKWRQTMNVAQHGARGFVPVDPRLGFVDLGGVSDTLIALLSELQLAAFQCADRAHHQISAERRQRIV